MKAKILQRISNGVNKKFYFKNNYFLTLILVSLVIVILSFWQIYGDSLKNKFAQAAALTSVTVAPAVNNVDNLLGNNNSTWRFTIDNETVLSTSTGAVEITFPTLPGGSPWILTPGTLTASSTALGGDLLNFATTSVAVLSGNRVLLVATSTQTSAANNFIIDVKNVGIPLGDVGVLGNHNWNVRTCTLETPGNPNSTCTTVDATSTPASAAIVRRGGLIDDWSFTASSYGAASTSVRYTVTFTASTTLSQGEKIYVNFPVGFNISGATTSDQTIVTGGTAQVASTTIATTTSNGLNAVILALSAGSYNAQTGTSTVSFSIGGITNPAKGAYQGFKLFTTTANGGLVDGLFFGQEAGFGYKPPPVDGIQIGGTNTLIGQAQVRNTNGTLRNLTAGEIAQVQVGMGCPDKNFFAGTKRLDSTGSFTYGHLIGASYMMGTMPNNSSDSTFFQSYLQPNYLMVNLTENETATVTPTFVVPDGYLVGTITGGPNSYLSSEIDIRAYTNTVQTFVPVHTDWTYATPGLSATGTGYFRMAIKSGQTWNFSVQPTSLTSGGYKYWSPDASPVYIDPGKATTTLSAWSFATASKTLNVTLQNSDGTPITGGGGGGPTPCINIRRAGSEMAGPGSDQGICVSSGGVYPINVPAGAFVIQVMMPGAGFKEYPVTILSSDTTVNKTIIISRPTTSITGTITDPDSFPIQGATVMAQGSNGTFAQGMSTSTGGYILYVSPGTYRVEAFSPGYGPLGAQTVILSGASATQNFTISSGNFKTIKGRVYTDTGTAGYDSDDTTYEGVNIHAYGNAGSNGAMSRNDGTYTLNVPAGSGYMVEAWSRDFGFIGTTTANATNNVTGRDFTVAGQGYLQLTITNANAYGLTQIFAHAYSTSTGKGNGTDTWTATSTDNTDLVAKFSLPAGFYKVEVGTPGFGNLTSLATNLNSSTSTIVANAITNRTIVLPSMATLSGTTAADATVWASRTNGPGKYNTTADSSGAYSMKIPTGYSYMIGASLPGYVNTPVATSSFSGGTLDLTLTISAYTISGTISSSGSGSISEGFVWASKSNNTGWMGSEILANGTYSLAVDSGTWTVYANAPCHDSSSGVSQTGSGTVNITLTVQSNCSFRPPQIQSIVPANGGSVATTGIAVNIPANALGDGTSNVSFSVSVPNTVPPATLNAAPLSGAARSIVASDSTGSITDLSNSIEITITYSDSDVVGITESNLQLAYWNTTTGTWDPVAAALDTVNNTLTASVDHLSDFAPIYPVGEGAPTTPTGLAATKSGDGGMSLTWSSVSAATSYLLYRDTSASGNFPYLITKTSTSHSDTGLTGGTTYYYKITASNAGGESAASTPAVSAVTCSSVANGTVSTASCTLTCNSGYTDRDGVCYLTGGGGGAVSSSACASVTYEDWQTTCASGWQYRNIKTQTPAGCALTAEQENQRKRKCDLATTTPLTTLPQIISETKEKITEVVGTASQAAKEFAQKVITIAADAAEIIKANINGLLGKLGFKRDLAKEDVATKKYVKQLIKDAAGLAKEQQYALTNFIAYGTETTLKLGQGERAGVVNSYKAAFGKLPKTEAEWTDAIKIANGRWPSQKNQASENNAETAFAKIYLRTPNRANANDDAAVVVMAYGLRPTARNLASEKAAIKSFQHIYGYAPKTATAWDIVRAIAYSGAKR